MEEKLVIFDTTLRDGEQSPGAAMNGAEKMRIAIQLEKLGVDVIEAGFPAASEGDFQAVQEIARAIKNTEVAGLARTTKSDLDLAWEAIRHAKMPRIHTFISTSDLHIKHKLNMTREQVLDTAIKAVRYAKSLCDNVEFSTEDGSRSDKQFLCEIFAAAIAEGATTINLADTVGYTYPKEFAEMVSYIRMNTPGVENVVMGVHCHNDLGLATSNTIAAVGAGARHVEVTINGIGERAGNTSLEEVVMAIKTRPIMVDVKTNIRTEELYETSRLVSSITGIYVQPNKAIVGANAFAHEAGIHQDGILKNPLTYEIMTPQSIGLQSNSLVLGKHSGRAGLRAHIEGLGLNVSDAELDHIFDKFKNLADKLKNITESDLETLFAETIYQTEDYFSLKNLEVDVGEDQRHTAKVSIALNGETAEGTNTGEDPLEAVFNVIADLSKTNAQLMQYAIVTQGVDSESLKECTVRLREENRIALGRGTGFDVIGASAKAYLNGLNRLKYLQKNPVLCTGNKCLTNPEAY